ncbi:hypothetical protein B0H16DRAFT_1458538 [Mycena metata]|uniref:Uncharacterized protein n=1 Tax=Mycena metata TaxID=1033252 RepID=A0AAD7J3Q4_9AGAR|nr:hypothetical protein B0H16DRAFT_1458538 [Mycena metata]
MANTYQWNGSQYSWNGSPLPPQNATPAHPECFGLSLSWDCTIPLINPGFCPAHQGHVMQLNSKAKSITAEERREHTEGRRCCGLTKKYQLCQTSSDGKYMYCGCHHDQSIHFNMDTSPGPEPREQALLYRESVAQAPGGAYPRRTAQVCSGGARAARTAQARTRACSGRARAAGAGAMRSAGRAKQADSSSTSARTTLGSSCISANSPIMPPTARVRQQESGDSSKSVGKGITRRAQQEEAHRAEQQARWADAEHQQREAVQRAREEEETALRAKYLQDHLKASEIFDGTTFSSKSPNSFRLIPWPVIPHLDGSVTPADITPRNICLFFHSSVLKQFKTPRAIEVILKNTARRFNPDRFNEPRPVVGSIRNWEDRMAVKQAADVVIKTINDLKS